MKKIFILSFAITALLLSACKKNDGCMDPTASNYKLEATKDDGSCEYIVPVETGALAIKVKHYWEVEATPFELNQEYINTTTGEAFTFSRLKYYVSNVRLKKQDGSWWSENESYYIVDMEADSSLTLNLKNVPVGNYTDVSFVMGVDSTRNVSGAQQGALSTSAGMFWSWNTGYIMLKAEGTSPASTVGNNTFIYHLGGFQQPYNIVTTKEAPLGGLLNVTKTTNPIIHIKANPSALFDEFQTVAGNETVHSMNIRGVMVATSFYNSGVSYSSFEN